MMRMYVGFGTRRNREVDSKERRLRGIGRGGLRLGLCDESMNR